MTPEESEQRETARRLAELAGLEIGEATVASIANSRGFNSAAVQALRSLDLQAIEPATIFRPNPPEVS